MSKLDEYKVENLFLLVGKNPLPNYVAALTLLKDSGKVYLVFTEHTKAQKNCLLKRLNEQKQVSIDKKIEPIYLEKYESDSYHIRDIIQKRIKSIKSGKIGLHYTGGTKAMAVHAYRAVQELKPDAIFSYLDSRSLEMCIDRPNNYPIREKVFLEISFTQLFGLHNLKWQDDRPPSTDPTLPDAAQEFADFYQDKDLAEAWKNWCKKTLRRQMKCYDRGNYVWKEEHELKAQPTIEIKSLPDNIKTILRQHLDASTDVLNISVTQKKGFNDLTHVCAWLDGVWLEDYVLQQVKLVASKYAIKAGMSFRIQDPENSWREKFEFDVAFMLGYQLFAISCTTTDSKSLCKQKLIEAHLRARQMGGDEARVALVCYYDKPGDIKAELRTTIDNRKIEVFGREDLPKLVEKIGNWINKNNRETNQ